VQGRGIRTYVDAEPVAEWDGIVEMLDAGCWSRAIETEVDEGFLGREGIGVGFGDGG